MAGRDSCLGWLGVWDLHRGYASLRGGEGSECRGITVHSIGLYVYLTEWFYFERGNVFGALPVGGRERERRWGGRKEERGAAELPPKRRNERRDRAEKERNAKKRGEEEERSALGEEEIRKANRSGRRKAQRSGCGVVSRSCWHDLTKCGNTLLRLGRPKHP